MESERTAGRLEAGLDHGRSYQRKKKSLTLRPALIDFFKLHLSRRRRVLLVLCLCVTLNEDIHPDTNKTNTNIFVEFWAKLYEFE